MIELENVSVDFASPAGNTRVFSGFSAQIPTDQRLVILAVEGAGKTSLARILSGINKPSAGKISRSVRVSFPVGFGGAFRRKLSVEDNVAHAARLYGTKVAAAKDFVRVMTDFDREMDLPFEDLSPHARTKLAFATGYALAFETYIFDDRISAGDTEFRSLCEVVFWERMKNSGCIILTKVLSVARKYATSVAFLKDNALVFYDDPDKGMWDFRQSFVPEHSN